MVKPLSVEVLGPAIFRVTVSFSFIFSQGGTEVIESFGVWLDGFEAPVDAAIFAQRIPLLPALARNGTISQNIDVADSSTDIFNVYFQVKEWEDLNTVLCGTSGACLWWPPSGHLNTAVKER